MACWLLPEVEPAVHKYIALWTITANDTGHGARGTRKPDRPSEMEGAHTTHKAARDNMKNATTLSCPAGNGSSEHNPNGTLRTTSCVI